jgi:hypothetical protein
MLYVPQICSDNVFQQEIENATKALKVTESKVKQ